jgi:general secretion pathway protein G
LIELLTVIAIIGILAAILIPTVGKVRESARFSKGSSNLREIARGSLLFAQDNKGWIPHDGFTGTPTAGQMTPALRGGLVTPWWNAIPPYLGAPTLAALDARRPSSVPTLDSQNSIFVCPNASSSTTNSNGIAWLCYAPSYKISDTVSTAPEGKFLANVNKIKEPSRTVLFAETTNHAPGQTGIFSTSNPAYLGAVATQTQSGSRWKGKSLVSFFDGSVKGFPSPELLAQSSDLKGTRGGPIWDIQ